MVPGVIPLELVIARNERAAVCVTRLGAYPTGFEFELCVLLAPGEHDDDLDPMLFGPMRHERRRRGMKAGLPDEMLRFGVQFADGTKATNTAGPVFPHSDGPPPAPVMNGGGGGGGGGAWNQTEWVWPLPPAGPLAFVCEWPEAAIPLSRAEIDAQPVLDAAGRAQRIFPDGGDRGDVGYTSSTTIGFPTASTREDPAPE
jgi:hypothetical protein